MKKVYIDGREGTTGLRIHDRLSGRPDLTLIEIDPSKRKDPAERKRLIDQADIVFLCLPDAAAIEAVAMAENPDTCIIDASTAHRTRPDWAYGFAELSPAHRRRIAHSKRIAVPGCHASGFLALVYPLVSSGLIGRDYPLVCHSVTGYSGGGKKMIAEYQDEDRDEALASPRQYALAQAHKHLPEMQAAADLAAPPVFMPIVADYYSGMVVTVPLHRRLMQTPMSVQAIERMYRDHYAGQPLISVQAGGREGPMLAANALSGRDGMEIGVFGSDERIVLTARFDNLGKGASGAAVQAMNIALGIDETAGLVK